MIREVRDHWSWRPNWRPGRSFYTWHVLFPHDQVIRQVRAAYQPLIDSLPGISPVPAKWLRLTLQGLGFADKVPEADVDPIIDAARQRLEHFRPFEIHLGPAVVGVEALQLPVEPVDRVRRLRAQLQSAITDVWGRDSVPVLPKLDPHVTLGYWNQAAPAGPLNQRVCSLGGEIATTDLTSVSLIRLTRGDSMYEWATRATVPLGL